MRKQLIAKIMQCDTAYQIREVWEEVTGYLKSDQIDMDDFIAIQAMKFDRLHKIEASDLQIMNSQFSERLDNKAQ